MSSTRPLPLDPIAEARRQWIAHDWAEPDAMSAATSIMRAQQIVLGRVDEALRPLGLTYSRYEALVLLYFSRRGSLPMGKMGERLMVHPTSVTNAVDRLEAEGLARRVPHPDDRRTVLAEITPAGKSLAKKATVVLVKLRFGLAELDDDEARELTSSLASLRSRVGEFTETAEVDEPDDEAR